MIIYSIFATIIFSTITINAQANDFGWLIGEWIYSFDDKHTIEKWEIMSDELIIGSSYTSINQTDSIIFSESLRILKMNNDFYYIAKVPQNKLPVPFLLTSQDNSTIVFVNEEHDFPQKIKYQKVTEDSMMVVIGLLNNEDSNREFNFIRR